MSQRILHVPHGDALPQQVRNSRHGRCSNRRSVRGILLKAFTMLLGEFYGGAEPCWKRGRVGCGGPWRAPSRHWLCCSLLSRVSRLSSWTPRGNARNSLSGSKQPYYKATCLLKLKSTFCKERLKRRCQWLLPALVYFPRFPAALCVTENWVSKRRTGVILLDNDSPRHKA